LKLNLANKAAKIRLKLKTLVKPNKDLEKMLTKHGGNYKPDFGVKNTIEYDKTQQKFNGWSMLMDNISGKGKNQRMKNTIKKLMKNKATNITCTIDNSPLLSNQNIDDLKASIINLTATFKNYERQRSNFNVKTPTNKTLKHKVSMYKTKVFRSRNNTPACFSSSPPCTNKTKANMQFSTFSSKRKQHKHIQNQK
jgi:hypothetical protein